MAIHAADVTKSTRLKKVLFKLVYAGGWVSTLDLRKTNNGVATHSDISELRANGYDIESRCVGRGRWQYRLNGVGKDHDFKPKKGKP